MPQKAIFEKISDPSPATVHLYALPARDTTLSATAPIHSPIYTPQYIHYSIYAAVYTATPIYTQHLCALPPETDF